MGSLFIQIGQCGCQIGSQLNPKLSNSYYCTRNRPPNRLHAIMIDTQPKVLQPFIEKTPKWLDPLNVKYFQHGRGNNWSYGYMHELPKQKFHGEIIPQYRQFSHNQGNSQILDKYLKENRQICEYTLDRTRKQLETVDCALCINVIGSLGGGTGSGLGTKIIEKIQQQFNIDVYSHVVLPNKSGQTPLQVYNCLLSLASIQQSSTAIFTYENDKMIDLFQQKEDNEGTLDEINKFIASNMSRMIKINDLPGFDRFYSNIISECILSQEAKYLNVFGSESKEKKWEEVFEGLFTQLKVYNSDSYANEFSNRLSNEKQKLLHGQLLLIGKEDPEFQIKYAKKLKSITNPMFQDSLKYEVLNYKGTHLSSLVSQKQQKVPKKQIQKCQSMLIANHSNILSYLRYLHVSGMKKYHAKAYLWHYQYADLETAFNKIQNVIDQYYYFTHH